MNSFKLTAVGNLVRNPELSTIGEVTFARFCLVGHDAVAVTERDPPEEVATKLRFLAYGDIATAIARGSQRGDQLILEAKVIGTQWTDKHGGRQYGDVFIVTGFRFGARRGDEAMPTACPVDPPKKPLTDAAVATLEEAT